MRRTLVALALLVVAIASTACGGSGSGPSTTPNGSGSAGSAASVTVTITGNQGSMSFSPGSMTLSAGQTVAWRNADSITHQIVQDSESGGGYGGGGAGFDTGSIPPGATSAPIAFSLAGTIGYHCGIHPSMVGTLTVR